MTTLAALLATSEGRQSYAAQLDGYNRDQLRTRRPFVWIMPDEVFSYPESADLSGTVEIGRAPDGQWLHSISAWDGRGGRFEALGYLAPRPASNRLHATRSAALRAAIDELVAWTAAIPCGEASQVGRSRLAAWGRGLSEPTQRDLFAL